MSGAGKVLMSEWYLVYTKPKSEDLLAKKFAACGFEVFNPRLKERRHIRKKVQDVISPLFPCYLFVKFDFDESYKLVKYTRGVRNVVGPDGVPMTVPIDIIDSIRKRMENDVVTVVPACFEPGDNVIIKGGPFKDFEAIFEGEIRGVDRVAVLLTAINARAVMSGYILEKT